MIFWVPMLDNAPGLPPMHAAVTRLHVDGTYTTLIMLGTPWLHTPGCS